MICVKLQKEDAETQCQIEHSVERRVIGVHTNRRNKDNDKVYVL